VRETFESAIVLGAAALEKLGTGPTEIADISACIRARDEQRLQLEIVSGLNAGRRFFSGRPRPIGQSASPENG
jgi:glutathione-regulated potassium-efflux system protein KefB